MRRYPLVIGLLFGALQTGYFLQLSFAFSSAAITFFGVTLAWLVGSLGGLLLARWQIGHWWQIGFASLACFLTCSATLYSFPLHNELLPLYLVLVAGSGLYAGWFFGSAERYAGARIDHWLFWENNGFVIGLIATTLASLFLGRALLQLLPILLFSLTFPPRQAVISERIIHEI